MRNKSWGHAREMRTLLERAREAQATRIAHDPLGDVRQLATADIDAAIQISGYRETVPEKISDTLVKFPRSLAGHPDCRRGHPLARPPLSRSRLKALTVAAFYLQGWISLTNHHVVTENKFVTVKLTTGRQLPGEVVRTNKTREHRPGQSE